jgi:hypothetical protein
MAEVLASQLSDCEVTLAIPARSEPVGDPSALPYRVVGFTTMSLPRLMFDADLIICGWS